MKDNNALNIPPQVQYEKEIREIYRERNAKQFLVPSAAKTESAHKRGELFIMLAVALIVSVITSVTTVSWLESLMPWAITQPSRSSVGALPTDVNDETVNNLRKSIVAIYPFRAAKSAGVLDNSYLVRESLGQGLVLSSDGWIVTTSAVVSNQKQTYRVVTADGLSRPTELVVYDPVVPLVYLKIKASNLTTTAFVDSSRLTLTQPVLAAAYTVQSNSPEILWRRLSNLSAVAVTDRGDLVFSTESVPDRFLLDQPLSNLSQGAPIFNLHGETVGLAVNFQGVLKGVVPLEHLTPVIDSLFTVQQVKRPALGINYIQANWLTGLTADNEPRPGAQLISSGAKPAVVPKSAAAKAQLKEGDQIVSLNGDTVVVRSLSAMLQQYRAGDTVEMVVKRAGTGEFKMLVKLGEIVPAISSSPAATKK